MPILVGDLGGTHTRLAHAELHAGRILLSQVTRYLNSEHADLDAILARFFDESGNRDPGETVCCLAVAGPTDGRTVQFTNLDWRIDSTTLSQRFGFAQCRLINDFSAVGWGLNTLETDVLATLQAGQPVADGARVALGAGTGLGVSLCNWRNDHYQPQASEGGHVGFAPCDSEQDRLLAFLRTLHGRVSVERILSGPGLDQSDPVAAHCLHLFSSIFGQTAGDWALATQAGGGIFLAGGIAPKLLPVLQGGAFMAGFNAKGRYREWMARVPVAVILDPDIGLKGAAFAVGNLAA
jgi:glucokinase